MSPEKRTKNLFKLLGWQGGTVHDATSEIGVDAHDFLHAPADFDDNGPCPDFRAGYIEAADIALYIHARRGNLHYWFGAVLAVENDFLELYA